VDRFICVHGHFYQPPRENPWLELVERQESAWPYHDWNERITEECYAPNAMARILDEDGRLIRVVNNYARISFNLGPTLLAWMQDAAPEAYAGVLEADRLSQKRFGGHGSALAQVYNHIIMPLATPRDRRTQIRWGLADFRARFGREPEGMWLAEAAADVDTLEQLVAEGVRFTVLSPFQAARTRPVGGAWTDVSGGNVDPTRPYRVPLPSGAAIDVFFYDGPISQAVAFEGLLESGETFAERLLTGFRDEDDPQLVNIATDGESYGHHHRHGEMALARALELLQEDPAVELTNYGQYLERFPPTHEAEIVSPSSWSCAHGVERWRADCGCTTGGEPGWNQAWRGPLREALDWLRDEIAPRYEDAARPLLRDPWGARDDYVRVLLDRAPETVDAFLERHATHPLDLDEESRALALLELQRHALLMYTSCGWFFEELSRIETVQVLAYAARVLQLAGDQLGARSLTGRFLELLQDAPSNVAQYEDGRTVFEAVVAPAVADLEKVAAHFAIAGLFGRRARREDIGCYEVDRCEDRIAEAGRAKMAYGRIRVRSVLTREEGEYEYGVVHLGDHNFACGVQPAGDTTTFGAMAAELEDAFAKADVPELIRTLDDHFGGHAYSLRDLFRDEQGRILRTVLDSTMHDVEAAYRNIYRSRAPMLRFLADLASGIPAPLRNAAQVVVNAELRDLFSDVDPVRIRALIDEADRLGLELDADGLAHALDVNVGRTAARIAAQLDDPTVFDRFDDEEATFFARIEELVAVARAVPFTVDLGRAQHVCYRAVHEHRPGLVERTAKGDEAAQRWVTSLDRLATALEVALPA
jgi:alpha-amylase/alpha-mannosidase (GH57 family)